jgi:hypothetical protein
MSEELHQESPAEESLRALACWLGVGGYNAPMVDVKAFEAKIREGVEMHATTHGFVARDLAEVVMAMDLKTPKGLRAKQLARRLLDIKNCGAR